MSGVCAKSTAKPAGRNPIANDFRQRRVVVAEQEPRRRCIHVDVDFAARGAVPGRQFDMKDRPAAGRVVEADLSAEPLDDLFDDTEAEARSSLAPRLVPSAWANFPKICDLNSSGIPEP